MCFFPFGGDGEVQKYAALSLHFTVAVPVWKVDHKGIGYPTQEERKQTN